MIRLGGVGKTYDDGTVAVQELDLDVERGRAGRAWSGPSGCGKSTTLKMINRLIEPTTGRIVIDGEDVTTVDPVKLRRGIGYVIQQIGLFPHQKIVTQRDDGAAAVRRVEGDRAGSGRASCSTWSGSTRRRTATATRTSSPAASGSASAWPARWRPTRRCC